ncbi:uncharacterized protein SPSK_04753 [Sporothrix schenckii 1099-18]|uniref:Uncharacterized protein n=1 Tax=Sporothrix schenckii 1099-18 TaxID=1397361 RepID=A0A0F2M194_SPOSC|nr:uncharacterized protein SPSK_04753 [Sporothrix schenckii 1099-18]KJR83458.1 hypothetical protein SPSK_04753 [Sporothrix schenckii 1099-18]
MDGQNKKQRNKCAGGGEEERREGRHDEPGKTAVGWWGADAAQQARAGAPRAGFVGLGSRNATGQVRKALRAL